MGLKPARTMREIKKQAWTRFSKRKPRKSFVKAMPHMAIQITSMGAVHGDYTHTVELVAKDALQVRDNALEASRQAANKFLEAKIPLGYHLFLRVYPHHVVREIKMVFGAGADRIQKGMKHAWGKPSERVARIRPNLPIFTARCVEKDLGLMGEAFRRAKAKLPGRYAVRIRADAAPSGEALLEG
jgi:large subunit ribosomal protein L10e